MPDTDTAQPIGSRAELVLGDADNVKFVAIAPDDPNAKKNPYNPKIRMWWFGIMSKGGEVLSFGTAFHSSEIAGAVESLTIPALDVLNRGVPGNKVEQYTPAVKVHVPKLLEAFAERETKKPKA